MTAVIVSVANVGLHYLAVRDLRASNGSSAWNMPSPSSRETEARLTPLQLIRVRYYYMAIVFIPAFLGSVSWIQLWINKGAAETDGFVMIYEGVALNCFFHMMLDFVGGWESIVAFLEDNGTREAYLFPFVSSDEEEQLCAKRCNWCCSYVNCKIITFSTSRAFLYHWHYSVFQLLPVKICLAIWTVISARLMDDGGESHRIWINVGNVLSMFIAVRANLNCWFMLRPRLEKLRPLYKYMTCRMVMGTSITQRLLVDLLIRDPILRFRTLNFLICCEMSIFALAWWSIFSPSDYIFTRQEESTIQKITNSIEVEEIDTSEHSTIIHEPSNDIPLLHSTAFSEDSTAFSEDSTAFSEETAVI